ncbi:hypothetical protein CEK29_11760 [Bordetella genomosp. 5]|uniref:Uncharacterized protein n=1 Tax=Bordetella genomosp. 5 TaxID=1395608 RepID=A0A261TR74_9BORD|nr:hypothetical protein [Bordetella genomosp. 5]OZI42432.1 hypothetical protein CEK29_11760 [Bordetella genomosp. 5]OZI52168.1 hypothetical protein CAL25_11835 [Bordetella genomosp. 5]
MELKLPYPPTPEHAPDLAGVVVNVVRNIEGVTLDFTPASLRVIDGLIQDFHASGNSAAAVRNTVFLFGCYAGEVIVRHLHARWAHASTSPLGKGEASGGVPLVLQMPGGTWISPIAKAYSQLANGAEDNLSFFYHVLAAESGQAEPLRARRIRPS